MRSGGLSVFVGCHKTEQSDFELHSESESAVRCGGSIGDLFTVVTGVCQGCVLVPTLFSACLDYILGRMLKR